MPNTAKVFMSGRSQAVRLPKAYRFEDEEVLIRKVGQSIILESIPQNWNWLDNLPGDIDDDCIEAALEQPPVQTRASLDNDE